ncbi:MAG TPA: phospholipid carrier-dependent glycosyltransferase [Acidobacteriaceae bacterium]
MPSEAAPKRPLTTTLTLVALWIAFYASFTLFRPALLDDADSVHAEVAREMLLRHDWVTLYANGIRYLEKAPLLYWSMAICMRVVQLLGHSSANALAVAARIPLALTVLALAFAVEAFARRAFRSARAGLYAALILLSSPGIFLFTRITLPDAMVCLWLTLAMLAFWLTEFPSNLEPRTSNLLCYSFSACCALNVLTKGLIGIVFPIAIVLIYLLLTRGPSQTITRIFELHPFSSTAVFLAIAAPWHILAACANLTRGNPGNLTFALHPAAGAGHFSVPLPTQGNVHGWLWFYFVNEQVLRYLNLRVPRDYDTVPLWLFWGLCLIWLMPWSAFVFKAIANAIRIALKSIPICQPRSNLGERPDDTVAHETSANGAPIYQPGPQAQVSGPVGSQRAEGPTYLLLILWAALPLIFFAFSTRQEYYVLPALPPLVILIAGWLALTAKFNNAGERKPRGFESAQTLVLSHVGDSEATTVIREGIAATRITAVLVAFGTIFAAAAVYFLLHTHTPAPNADLAALLQQNPSDYAMSMGHFLDLNAQALGLFRLPLALAAASLFLGPLASYILRKLARPHAATLALAAGAFGFLLAADLGLQTFAPVLSSAQLAASIAPQLHPDDLIVIHQEYEYASTLGFYLQRPGYPVGVPHSSRSDEWDPRIAVNPIHILTDAESNGVANYGRSSNLWYGSFFPDAPAIFETPQTLAQKWPGPQRIFLWQDLANQPSPLPALPSRVYVIAKSGGKEIVSNQPNR